MPTNDPAKQAVYWRTYYDKNKEDVKRRAAAHTAKMRKWQRALIIKVKSVPCMDCRIQYPHYVMQFDHVRGEKKFTISSFASRVYVSQRRLLDEIAKCEVVCANCHAIRTYNRRQAAVAQAG